MNRHQRRLDKKAAPSPAGTKNADAPYREATGHHAAGRLADAAAAYRRVLAIDPRHPDSLHLLGVIAYQEGRPDEAVPLMREAVRQGTARGLAAETLAAYLGNLGSALQASGHPGDATAAFRDSLRLLPGNAATHANLGNALKDLRQWDAAIAALREAVRLRPDYANAYNTLGGVYEARGALDDAVAAFRQAAALTPDAPLPLLNLAGALRRTGAEAEAEACFRRVLTLETDHPAALHGLASLWRAQGLREAAEACLRHLLTAHPDHAAGHLELGVLLAGALNAADSRPAEAAAHIDQALALDPALAAAHNSRGALYQRDGRHADAETCFRRALALNPDDAEAHNNLGTALELQGRRGEAAAHYARAAALDPALADARFNLALTALATGDLARGWPLYEARWDGRQMRDHRRAFPCPSWRGEDLAGRHLLVWREQGLGDEILFASQLPDLLGRVERAGGRLTVEVDPRLTGLLGRALPGAAIRAVSPATVPPPPTGTGIPDYHLPLGSLPGLLRADLAAFTTPAAPWLRAETARVARWRDRLPKAGLSVGICWRSGLRGGHRDGAYSHLRDWAGLAAIPGVRLVTLQYDDAAAEIADFEAATGHTILRWPDLDLRDDLEEVAALTTALDLVISAPTAVAELTAALGVPCWRLTVGEGGDWSMLGTGVRPWFPAQRVISGDSAAMAVARAAAALRGA